MNWAGPADLRAQAERLWERGVLLRGCVNGAEGWPLRLSFKAPTPSDLSDRFEAVRAWIGEIVQIPQVRVEWREWTHRVQGKQRLPVAIWIDSPQDALALIGKSRDLERYQVLWRQTSESQPALLAWVTGNPLKALELADRWERLLAVVAWMQTHPRPGVYPRQMDASGVDSKFMETHRGVLMELLDLALPPEAVEANATGVTQFNRRYGFRDKPVRIRFRLLDQELPSLSGCGGLPDITLDALSFAALTLPIKRVFITENETNFLAFPPMERAFVIFGAGYGWESLGNAVWLQRSELLYWGDIDTHGFAILDQLRRYFPHTASLLMDRETLLAHRSQWTEESEPASHDLARLDAAEAALYNELRFGRIQPRLRLEQERIGFWWLSDRLKTLAPPAIV
jgi:hypothetical protein